MADRSPARFLAPLALLAAVATIYLVARPELGGGPKTSTSTTAAKSSSRPTTTTARREDRSGTTRRKAEPKIYTVKPGDVLGDISDTTGVSLVDLLDYNDLQDPQSLRVGQKLKLTP